MQVCEADLHAYVDGQLDSARWEEVEQYLATHPEDAERVYAYQRQNNMLRAMFDPVLAEPVPEAMERSRPRFFQPLRAAAAVGWLALGGLLGWSMHSAPAVAPNGMVSIPTYAAVAHVVYTPEVRHPVEVGADQEAHLVAWLSKRLGKPVKAPQLNSIGFNLVGGRLLPGETGPAAQFMYQNTAGQRLTLYVRTGQFKNRETAFRYAKEGNVGVFYWVDGPFGYALSGELERDRLLEAANIAYRSINP